MPLVRVACAALLAFVALAGWSFAYPVGASPDDNFHQASIWCAQGLAEGQCEQGSSSGSRLVPESVANSSVCHAFHPEQSGRCEARDDVLVETAHGNFIGLYPPVFYAAMSVFVVPDVALSVLMMRVFNSLFAVLLFSVLYVFLPSRLRTPLLWGALATCVPFGMYLVSSLNPSSWAFLSAATVWVSLYGYFLSEGRVQRLVLAFTSVLAVLIGAGSRGDSAVFACLGILVACILAFERTVNWLRKCIFPAALLLGAFGLYRTASQVGSAVSGDMSGQTVTVLNPVSAAIHTFLELPIMWFGNFGMSNLGWGDTHMPAIVWATVAVLSGAIVFIGLGRTASYRKTIALGIVGVAAVAIPTVIIVLNGVEVGELVQPRYVLPLQVLFISVSVLGLSAFRVELGRLQRFALLFGFALANSVALHTLLRRYLTGEDYTGLNLDSGYEWWWHGVPSPNFVWICSSFAFFVLLSLLLRPFSGYQVQNREAIIENTTLEGIK